MRDRLANIVTRDTRLVAHEARARPGATGKRVRRRSDAVRWIGAGAACVRGVLLGTFVIAADFAPPEAGRYFRSGLRVFTRL
jgi:hypothetical protein